MTPDFAFAGGRGVRPPREKTVATVMASRVRGGSKLLWDVFPRSLSPTEMFLRKYSMINGGVLMAVDLAVRRW